ncbi:MAG: hypothetical protein JKY62_01420 [Desulfocapsa sp.]|nr:hypothetical protein [Desulfocapsa sp.]
MLNDVQSKFKELRLKHCSENIATLLMQAKEKNLSTLQVIDRLLAIEIEQRHSAKIKRLFRQSKLLEQPTIDQFDFSFHASLLNVNYFVRFATITLSGFSSLQYSKFSAPIC